jgi:hypothetical protein
MQINHVLKWRHPIEFSYMLGGIILDRVDSINDLGVVMDSKVSFTGHIEVTIGRSLAMLGFMKRLSCKFRDPYTLKTLYVPFLHLKVEYVSCVWLPFYGAEEVRKVCIAWFGDRCSLIVLVTLAWSKDVKEMLASCLFLIFCLILGYIHQTCCL